ncbi:hypothetical protein BV20DRAFT_111320 [Pilatotrama ljubarskyi]|nr:hypothetical protein BV20DRAFT_111320 [Pilatotrama ljubarskyi]
MIFRLHVAFVSRFLSAVLILLKLPTRVAAPIHLLRVPDGTITVESMLPLAFQERCMSILGSSGPCPASTRDDYTRRISGTAISKRTCGASADHPFLLWVIGALRGFRRPIRPVYLPRAGSSARVLSARSLQDPLDNQVL